MQSWAGMAIVLIVGGVVLRGWRQGCDVYGAFLQGAQQGMKSALGLLPALCAMLMMLAMMNASGLTELLAWLLSPVTKLLHLPDAVTPMLLLRPLTGSGSLAVLESIFQTCGPDSREGRIASVLMGSSETIFYTMTVYLGAGGIRRLPHMLWVSLAAYGFAVVLTGCIL